MCESLIDALKATRGILHDVAIFRLSRELTAQWCKCRDNTWDLHEASEMRVRKIAESYY